MVSTAVKPYFDGLNNVNQKRQKAKACNPWKPYISPCLGGVHLLNIGPHIPITCEVCTQVVQRLPNKHYSPVRWSIEELPVHRLEISDNFRSGQEVLEGSFRGKRAHQGISVTRHKVHVRQLQSEG